MERESKFKWLNNIFNSVYSLKVRKTNGQRNEQQILQRMKTNPTSPFELEEKEQIFFITGSQYLGI